jgi:uncharacterized protein YdeI (YjbR/CyaY-like superfamily)
MPAGLKRLPTDRSGDAPRPRLSGPKVRPYIEKALKMSPTARRHFESLAASHRRRYIGWIDSAKREETKLRRLQEAISRLVAWQTLGLK